MTTIGLIILVILCVGIVLIVFGFNSQSEIRSTKRNNLISEFGNYTSICIYNPKNFLGEEVGLILVDINNDKILINNNTYKISKITECKAIITKAETYNTYTEKQVIQTNTGNAVGRAIVGGVLGGGVGAIIGGTTAEKEIKTIKEAHTNYRDASYFLSLSINNSLVNCNVHAKSEYDINRICNFINSAIEDFNKLRKNNILNSSNENKKEIDTKVEKHERVCNFIAKQQSHLHPMYLPEVVEESDGDGIGGGSVNPKHLDPLFSEIAKFVVNSQQGSTSMIQRNYTIGYNRAVKIMDQLEYMGVVGAQSGSKPREVLIKDPLTLESLLNSLYKQSYPIINQFKDAAHLHPFSFPTLSSPKS